jgi:hypothetical protein
MESVRWYRATECCITKNVIVANNAYLADYTSEIIHLVLSDSVENLFGNVAPTVGVISDITSVTHEIEFFLCMM